MLNKHYFKSILNFTVLILLGLGVLFLINKYDEKTNRDQVGLNQNN